MNLKYEHKWSKLNINRNTFKPKRRKKKWKDAMPLIQMKSNNLIQID